MNKVRESLGRRVFARMLVLILVILIALVVIFKGQITKIVSNAFNSITNNADAIIN